MGLKPSGIYLGGDINFYNLFIAPFGRGDQFALYLAAWFLFNLYFVSIFAGIVLQKNIKVNIGIIAIACIFMLIFLHTNEEPNSSILPFISRSIFGFCFLGFGYLFRLAEPRMQKLIIKPVTIVVLYLIVNILSANFGNIWYSILFGNVRNDIVIVPVITTFCIIFMVYIISFYLDFLFKLNPFIYEIGRHSGSIMSWHLFFFFVLNWYFYERGFIPLAALSNVYFNYNLDKLWLFYQIPAIALPVLMAMYYHNLKQKFKLLLIRNHFTNSGSPRINAYNSQATYSGFK